MIINCTCTIVRQADDGSYFAVNREPHECMWQETEAIETKEYGAENADRAAIYIPDITADVKKGDYICKGSVSGDIDVSEMLKVTSAEKKDYSGEDLRHIKVGAR